MVDENAKSYLIGVKFGTQKFLGCWLRLITIIMRIDEIVNNAKYLKDEQFEDLRIFWESS